MTALWKRGGARIALDKPGYIYVVAPVPELRPDRLKIGFTAQLPADRLAQIQVANPFAQVLASWPGTPLDELRAHELADGRIGMSEVFDCRDRQRVIQRLTDYFTVYSGELPK
jgi:hypothetical protein